MGARFWSIQAGAFTNPAAADALRGQLAGAGIAARVDTPVREGKLMRLVRVGVYPTCAAAEADLAEVRRIRSDAFAVPASLIMRVHPTEIEVFVGSQSEGNPYHAGEKAPLILARYRAS